MTLPCLPCTTRGIASAITMATRTNPPWLSSSRMASLSTALTCPFVPSVVIEVT